MNITHILFEQVAHRPEALAIRHSSGDLTYREFGARVAGAAACLKDAGVLPREAVAICLDDPLAHWTATLALAHVGATVVSIPRSMPDLQRERLMGLTQCTRIMAGDEDPPTSANAAVKELRWSAIQAVGADGLPQPAVVDPDQPWIYVSGSGSTGRPKIIPITHGQEGVRRTASKSSLPYGPEDVVHSLVSMHFSSAKHRALEAFSVGAAVSLGMPGRVDYRDEVSAGLITVMHGMVFHIEQLLSMLPANATQSYQGLTALMMAGSTVPMPLRVKIKERLTPRLFIRWGANESGAATATRADSVFSVPGSVGYPLPGFQIEIVDGAGTVRPTGVDGLIRLSSAAVIDGYLGDSEATQKAFRDGWFYPGDIGHFTADGQLVHRGRADDMMIVSGVNVYPAEIEECLRGHPGVVDALAAPLRHPQVQEVPVALVVAEPGRVIDPQALVEHVRNRIGRHTLHDLRFVDRIPRNEQGKVQRESVAEILHAQWGAGRRPPATPAVSAGRAVEAAERVLSVAFAVPPAANPDNLRAWIAVLDPQQAVPAASCPARDESGHGEVWLTHVLTLALGLLHVLRLPVFDPIEILQCQRVEPHSANWRAVCRSPEPSVAPAQVVEEVIKEAFRMAAWLSQADANAVTVRTRFFHAIETGVLKTFANLLRNGKSTFEVLRVAHRLGVPSIALPGGAFQLGWGRRSRRIDRSTTDRDSAMGMCWAQNKLTTAQLLRQAGLPFALHVKVDNVVQARQAAQHLGYPVVIKPADMEQGEGVSVDVQANALETAFNDAQRRSRTKAVLVERQVPGVCHRIFIAGGKLLYAVKRLPMGVYGDGRSPIRALVAAEWDAQQRRPPWQRSGLRPLDDLALQMLQRQGVAPASVPAAGQFIALRRIETTAWGGVDEEVTATIHPANVSAAISAAQLFGLEVAGVDMISADIQQPWHSNGAIINEVNYAPLLGGGEISRRYIGEYLSRILDGDGRIPILVYAIGTETCAQGKAHWDMLRASGLNAFLVEDNGILDPAGMPMMTTAGSIESSLQTLLMQKGVDIVVLVTRSSQTAQYASRLSKGHPVPLPASPWPIRATTA